MLAGSTITLLGVFAFSGMLNLNLMGTKSSEHGFPFKIDIKIKMLEKTQIVLCMFISTSMLFYILARPVC